ncbi:peptidylprolyl isomerase [Polaribacter aquimarinus]|uniref:peptidylprolyl isomerase n=1 Tax=Polaribacter aquimarinus TaxID=2100726 RepID=A0A2U2J7A3_9FLAO|nr:peptidylprolyl isomerase [Polaribacter aquimarinus]PWG04225.1 peptidylprolyl isomerase [Polaribacter aquimarinus]
MNRTILYILAFVTITACKPTKYNDLEKGLYAEIHTNKGDILLELYADKVPMTVANFVSLIEGTNNKLHDSLKGKNFYEGIIFHRVVNNFVIQGGGFTPKGRKPAGYVFGDEFPKNKEGDLLYKHDDVGVLSMANGGPSTNNSQFFITHRAIPHLNGKHSVFGKTTVNPNQLKEIKTKFKDSEKIKKAIDSVRMSVVNSITQGDTINSIEIIRVGYKATSFNAANVFDNELQKFSANEKDRKAEEFKVEQARYTKYLSKKVKFLEKMEEPIATKTESGLRVLMLKKTKGKKVDANKPLTVHFTLFVADGTRIQSSLDPGMEPFSLTLSDPQRPMIAGFKEGLLKMREGEKARLFIPYYIGYGEEAFGPFPKKADLMFEVEVLKVGE